MLSIVKTFGVASITIKQKIIYRSSVWFGTISVLVSILVYFFLWSAIFAKQTVFRGYTFPMMVTYVVISRVLASQFSGGVNLILAEAVYEGSIGVELLRPIGLIWNLLAQRLGEFAQFVIFKALPVSVFASIILGGMPPSGWKSALLFAVSVIMSILLLFFMEVIMGLVSFYTLNYDGVRFAKDALLAILSGGLAPISIFPETVRRVFLFLPFQNLISTPINIYLGILSAKDAIIALGIEALWTAVFGILAFLFYQRAIKKVIVQGG